MTRRSSTRRGRAALFAQIAQFAQIALLAASSLTAVAHAQSIRAPARVTVESLFGQGTLLFDGYVPVLVTVENLTRSDYSGEVALDVRGYRGSAMSVTTRMDLPAGETRRAVLTIFLGESGNEIRARFLVDERVLAANSATVDHAPGGRSVIVFGDPPRLRGALLDLDVDELLVSGPRQVRVPVGTVRFEPATGDPMLPTAPGGYATVKLLVASAPALERANEAQRAAIEDWLRTGGRLLVFPRTEADLGRPWLTALAGPIVAAPASVPRRMAAEPRELVPDVGVRFELACSEAQRTELFGCSAPVGVGRVYVASYDGTTPAAIESGVPRELVRSVVAAPDAMTPTLAFGRGEDDLSQSYWTGAPTFGRLRAALDPNEGFRPALGLVALLLFLYVIVVGPVNFRWVQKKNRPTLALLTTPLAAAGCAVLLLVVGYVGKGVTMRYRRVELVEALEGETRVPARRYTGVFATRPGSYDLPGPTDGSLMRRIGADGGRGPVHRVSGSGVSLADFRAGLWETAFLREERLIVLDGPLRFERDDRRLASVVNGSSVPLMGAIVVDTSGSVYVVGDVSAHGAAPIPREAALGLGRYNPTALGESDVRELARRTGIDEDHEDALGGVIYLCGSAFVPAEAPVLYARLPARRERLGGIFAPELDMRWIRLMPRLEGAAVVSAPASTTEEGAERSGGEALEDDTFEDDTFEDDTFEDETVGDATDDEVGDGLDGGPAAIPDAGAPAAAADEPIPPSGSP
jgi:hypothetical protein